MDRYQSMLETERFQSQFNPPRMSQAAAASMIANARPTRHGGPPMTAPSRAGRSFFKITKSTRFKPQVQKTVDSVTQRENIAIFRDLYTLYVFDSRIYVSVRQFLGVRLEEKNLGNKYQMSTQQFIYLSSLSADNFPCGEYRRDCCDWDLGIPVMCGQDEKILIQLVSAAVPIVQYTINPSNNTFKFIDTLNPGATSPLWGH
ncbi:hypothetical protein T492DRAFT_844669 [Pavlovales sp. CCMP2436]|nr:hypothetical protein T492DRAFT_844669 [Pavlovales sp. CCMP2436]